MNALHVDASRPVEGDLFVNRVAELRRLDVALGKLRAGRADYLSVLVEGLGIAEVSRLPLPLK